MRMKLPTRMALGAILPLMTVRASNIHAPHDPRKVLQVSTTMSSRSALQPSQNHPKQLRRVMGADWDRMPSLFTDEEEIYDRYAACLAATEGLRRIRDRDLAEVAQLAYEAGGDTSSSTSTSKSPAMERKQIVQNYIQNSSRVLRAMGMPVKQFNELGREIAQSEKLKGRIMEQAYLYRMAATINMDRSHFLDGEEDSSSGQGGSGGLSHFQRDKVRLFCESMSEIERLRAGQVMRLMRSLGVENFPDNCNISDPALLPFLSPRVRAVVEAFPLQAEAIVKKHGLESEEFNQMLRATKTNPIFRWKIQKQLRIGDIHGTTTSGLTASSGVATSSSFL